MATDPICGMDVNEAASKLTSERNGRKYYFCSETCKMQFEKPENEIRQLKTALIISWPLTAIVVLLTYVLQIPYGVYVMFLFASIIQFYAGARFYEGTADAIKNRSANMDTLIAIGTSAAWLYSTLVVFIPSAFPIAGIYFDTSTIIISLILTGTFMQRLAESKASSAISALIALQPKIAHVVRLGKIVDTKIEKVKVNDVMLVKVGETIPADSIVVEGTSYINESMITGESMPILKGKGERVIGGTLNTTGPLRVKALKEWKDGALSQIVKIVEDAASSKVPIQKMADKISSYFVPLVIAIAIVSSLAWYLIGGIGLNTGILIFVSVLIIACPCALGIATPAALLVSSGVAAKEGILIKSGEALQVAGKVDAIVLDKTGTLTQGKAKVTDIITVTGYSEREVIRLAAIAETSSEHVLGKAIIERANNNKIKLEFPKKVTYTQGSGLVAVDKRGRTITVGNIDLFSKEQLRKFKVIERLESDGKTVLIVGVNKKVVGLIALADTLKEDSKRAVSSLKDAGNEVWLITGDNAKVANAIARQVGIRNVIAGAKPADKMKKIVELQSEGRVVAMIGDGVNDAPALTKADIGIAIGSGTDVAIQAGGIVLIRNRVSDAVFALELGKKTMAKIRENLFWAFGYNIILIPIAAGALIPFFTVSVYGFLPMLAALAMAFSSTAVISNSLLLTRFKAHAG